MSYRRRRLLHNDAGQFKSHFTILFAIFSDQKGAKGDGSKARVSHGHVAPTTRFKLRGG